MRLTTSPPPARTETSPSAGPPCAIERPSRLPRELDPEPEAIVGTTSMVRTNESSTRPPGRSGYLINSGIEAMSLKLPGSGRASAGPAGS